MFQSSYSVRRRAAVALVALIVVPAFGALVGPGAAAGPAAAAVTCPAAGCLEWDDRWSLEGHSRDEGADAVLSADGSLFFVAGSTAGGAGRQDALVLAVRTDSGDVAWSSAPEGDVDEEFRAVAAAEDGGRVVAAGVSMPPGESSYGDGLVAAFDAATGEREWSVLVDGGQDYYDELFDVALSPDGTTVVAVGMVNDRDAFAIALDAATGAERWRFSTGAPGLTRDIARVVAFDPAGDVVYLAAEVRTDASTDLVTLGIRVGSGEEAWRATWDAGFGLQELVHDLVVHDGEPRVVLTGMAYDPSRGSAATVAYRSDGALAFANLERGDELYYDVVRAGAVLPDLGLVAVAGEYRPPGGQTAMTTFAYRLSDGSLAWTSSSTSSGSFEGAMAAGASPDGSRVVVAGYVHDSTIPVAHGWIVAGIDGATGAVAWTAEHASFLTGPTRPNPAGVGVLADGRVLVGGSLAGPGERFDAGVVGVAADGAIDWTARFDEPADADVRPVAVAVTDTLVVTGAVASGRSGYSDYAVAATDSATGERRWLSTADGLGYHDDLRDLVATPDGSVVIATGASDASDGRDDELTVAWDAATGERLWTARYSTAYGNLYERGEAAAVTPDGSTVIVAGTAPTSSRYYTGLLVAYDVRTGSERWRVDPSTFAVRFDGAADVAVSPDGTVAYVVGHGDDSPYTSGDALVAAVDVATGARIWAKAVNGRASSSDSARSVAVTPDGSSLVVTGRTLNGSASYDLLVMSLRSEDGALEWASEWGTSAYDEPRALALDRDGARAFIALEQGIQSNERKGIAVAFDVATGAREWVRSMTDTRGLGAIEADSGGRLVYVGGGLHSYAHNRLVVRTLDAATGEVLLTFTHDGPGQGDDEATVIQQDERGRRLVVAGASPGTSGERDGLGLLFLTPAAPLPPRDAVAERGPGAGRIRVSWSPPLDDGGTPLEAYVVSRGPVGGPLAPVARVAANATSFLDEGLAPGAVYAYAVVAENERGASGPSVTVTASTPDVPEAPLGLAVRHGPGPSDVTAEWGAPAADGGLPVTGFVVYRGLDAFDLEPHARVAAGSFSLVVGPLPPNTTFWFAVAAENEAGEGSRTPVVDVTTLRGPSAPTAVAASREPGPRNLTVSWDAPERDEGWPVVAYVVHRALPGGDLAPHVRLDGSNRSFVDANVTPDTLYRYAVSAVTAVGEGERSDVVEVETFGFPSAPASVAVARGPRPLSLAVEWSPPVDDGGLPVDAYRVYRWIHGVGWRHVATYGADASSHEDPVAEPSTGHRFRVAAVSAVGEGPAAESCGMSIDTGARVLPCP